MAKISGPLPDRINVNINAVGQRAGNLRHISLDHRRRAVALPQTVVEESTGLRVTSLLKASWFIYRSLRSDRRLPDSDYVAIRLPGGGSGRLAVSEEEDTFITTI